MNEVSERIDASPALQVLRVDENDPLLRLWLLRVQEQNPHFSHARGLRSGCWLGLYVQSRLRAVIGFTLCVGDVVLVDYLMCDPSKEGRAAMIILVSAMREQWRGQTVRFFCEKWNRKVRRIVERMGATPVAYMYELPSEA